MLKDRKSRELRVRLLRWYRRNGRPLPWRKTTDPYRILVSEVMLQQTQVNRVLEMYPKFLRRFPTVRTLAKARQRDVVIAWRGMGYNNRAVRLYRLAKVVAARHQAKIMDCYEDLVSLPGIGRYTANAILSSAFGMRAPIVDTNVRRVLSRLLWKMRSFSSAGDESLVWEAASALLPRRSFYDWNQALMDLGATICTARAPRCTACPVVSFCSSTGSMVHDDERRIRKESSFNGIPNRIYRGRIINLLRKNNGSKPVDLVEMKREILGGRRGGVPWFRSVLRSLEKDGLVRLTQDTQGRNQTVSLA